MSATRDRIAAQVARDPGIHFNELVRVLDLAPGQVQYHLRRLDVVADERYGQTHYFPEEYDAWERGALALLRRETAADIVSVLMESGPLGASETADRAGIARSTLSWHLDRLVESDLVEKRHDRGRIVLALADPGRTARLLDRAEPTLPGRLVDRFTRLVDALLAE
ncbi:winged helix-turn-helix transcriptional regulator [Halorarius litoreus]|uniref:winged helix-turn-helix transcriptional regulator n=1 Tax=Halorarius litoreus TaxID=2962676 RepID=UPI0020CC438C|nr:ArsR family transcriptional regulator [Halorarius litoreus]